jgi:uncharacterized protein (TIGR02145 family)
MRLKILAGISFLSCGIPLFCQIPGGFNYQAIARDETGNPIINTTLPVTITIKSDSVGGTIYWEELHPTVSTNDFGLLTLIIGKGSRQTASTAATFDDINWNLTPIFIKTQVFYKSQLLDMGTARLWSVPYAMVAGSLDGSVEKLEVAGKTTNMEEALFEVKNKDGKTVFAVYNEGVRVFVGDGLEGKGKKGGFAVGGFDMTKGSQNYFVVNSDSIRAYIDTNTGKAKKGGFAVGGFDMTKATNEEYLRVTRDSTRIYLNTEAKGKKSGFAVGGFDATKGARDEYLRVTTDSVKVSKSLLIPRLTTEERDNLPFTPGDALIIFNMTESCMQIYKNNVWSNIWCFNCAPDFIFQPVNKTICSGENAEFSISATGTSLSYQWQESSDNGASWHNIYNGGSAPGYSGCNGYTLSLRNVPVSYHNFKYRCVVTGSCQPYVTSNVATLNVGSTPPMISSQPIDQVVSGTCSASFSIVSPGYGVNYHWQVSANGGGTWDNISDGGTGPVYSGANASILSLTSIPWICNNYKYRCTVGNACGINVTSNSASLTISPFTIMTQPADAFLSDDCMAAFEISITEGYVGSFQWQVSSDNGVTWVNVIDGGTNPIYDGAHTSRLMLGNVPFGLVNYEYRCSVSILCGPTQISNTAKLTVDNSSAITSQPTNWVVYNGGNIIFSITTIEFMYGYSFNWEQSTDGGSSWTVLSDGGSNPAYTGTQTRNLSLANIPQSYDTFKYRCKVKHPCRSSEYSNSVQITMPIPQPVTDIDGNIYSTVGINTELWMAENLKTTKYSNGDLIGTTTPVSLNIENETTPKYQWPGWGNESYVADYGRLYTWFAVNDSRNICPTGWHVSTNEEWNEMIAFLGVDPSNKLKEAGTLHWQPPESGATNETGFTARGGGFRNSSGIFDYCFVIGSWATSNAVDYIYYYTRGMGWNTTDVGVFATSKYYGNSVRCIKD